MSDADLPRCIPKPPFLLENRFVQPAPPNGRKQWSKRKMEPDVALALTDEYIAKIHAQPESAAGQRMHLLNLLGLMGIELNEVRLKFTVCGRLP